MRWWPVLLVIAVIAGCGEAEEQQPAATPAPVRSAEHRYSAELPAGWHRAELSLTPSLGNPVEILSAGTVADMRPAPGSCAHMPVGALERLGPTDAFVSVQERYGEPQFPDRPDRIVLPPSDQHNDAAACARNGKELDIHWFELGDAGRGFHVLVAFGRAAAAERRAEALALLDSLRFEPGPQGVHLDPDMVVATHDREAGLFWQMPVPPWRRYDWPLTSVHVERLVLGTFALEPGPPDRNCTPRAAIDALPPDGAFIYVSESLDASGYRERSGEIALGPERPYECMGVSRMARWQEHGRAFQAHVYLGPRASDALERDVRSIMNSIEVLHGGPT